MTQLDLQVSQCSSVHILHRYAIARYKYCASHGIRKNTHVHRYLLPLPLMSTTMASPIPSPRRPSLHRADGHAMPFRSSPPLVEEDTSPFHSSPPLVEEDASAFRSMRRRSPSRQHARRRTRRLPATRRTSRRPPSPPALRSFGKKWMLPCGRLCLQQSAPK